MGRGRLGVWFAGVCLMLAASGTDASAAETAARLRIKNGHALVVALGKTREAASGVRPDKGSWTLEVASELTGASAELEDVTPNVTGARWSVPVTSDRVVLDAARFLPSHVYRVEVRRARQLLGKALVFLYPPPASRVTRVELGAEPDAATRDESDDAGPAPLAKGRL